MPFFTTVPHNALNPANPDFGPQIPTLNATFEGLNQVFTTIGATDRIIEYSETETNPVLIHDEHLDDLSEVITVALQQGGVAVETATVLGFLYGQSRQATSNDLLLLTSQAVIASLNEEALATLQGFGLPTQGYNEIIANLATEYDLAFFDANSFMKVISETGVPLSDGSIVTAAFATGGGFSLDGIHPSPRGLYVN